MSENEEFVIEAIIRIFGNTVRVMEIDRGK